MSTAGPLSDRSKKELAEMARLRGVRGWDTMSKEELVRAIARAAKSPAKVVPKAADPARKPLSKPVPPPPTKTASRPAALPVPQRPAAKSAAKVTKPAKVLPSVPKATPPTAPKPGVNGSHGAARPGGNGSATPIVPPKPVATLPPTRPLTPSLTGGNKPPVKPVVPAPKPTPATAHPAIPSEKDLSSGKGTAGGFTKDRILMMVPDPYWLHAYWELTHQSVQRAEAALRQDWHGARPIIRLFDVTSQDTTSTSETPVRDIIIVGGCNNWYIDVPQPPRSYRADIGYVSRRGDFYVLARSNVVTPPKAGTTEALDVGWSDLDAKKAERIMAMSTGFEASAHPELKELFEERLRRPMGAPKDTGFGTGAALPGSLKKFFFEIDAELIVYGKTEPNAHVTLQNEPVQLRADGTFTMLFSLPDSRQIIPAVATSIDGVEERTIVLAVERNTKHLDPMIHDQMGD